MPGKCGWPFKPLIGKPPYPYPPITHHHRIDHIRHESAMNEILCYASGCGERGRYHLTRIEGRRMSEEAWYCHLHVNDFVNRRGPKAVDSPAERLLTALQVELDLIIYDQELFHEQSPCWVRLRELAGDRYFAVPTGFCETTQLEWAVRDHQTFNRPLTHQVFASLIDAVGGKLEYAVIDAYQADHHIFEAKLRIKLESGVITIDVRPSDAFVIAVICAAPLFVATGVLEATKMT